MSSDEDLAALEEILVRDVDGPADLGKRTLTSPHEALSEEDPLKIRGWGTDLATPARREIKESIDLEAHRGEHVATVRYDLESWSYEIEYHVPRSVLSRIRSLIRGRS